MDIEEIHREKAKLENKIHTLVKEFSDKTKTNVSRINLEVVDKSTFGKTHRLKFVYGYVTVNVNL